MSLYQNNEMLKTGKSSSARSRSSQRPISSFSSCPDQQITWRPILKRTGHLVSPYFLFIPLHLSLTNPNFFFFFFWKRSLSSCLSFLLAVDKKLRCQSIVHSLMPKLTILGCHQCSSTLIRSIHWHVSDKTLFSIPSWKASKVVPRTYEKGSEHPSRSLLAVPVPASRIITTKSFCRGGSPTWWWWVLIVFPPTADDKCYVRVCLR